jgi:hypothetical protein
MAAINFTQVEQLNIVISRVAPTTLAVDFIRFILG